ncbi:hypothetical protein BG015_004062 [Linnemannia schmuckeri]|uniref:FRG1-like family-domain-containing protein n=1 Tax=Linnemannia schmuckeri TaxID=64567 RepID=A0A9P5V1J2_9FUNG|nr:hypothetical protein BG015_004062 [Linnemannia schmuckeri]
MPDEYNVKKKKLSFKGETKTKKKKRKAEDDGEDSKETNDNAEGWVAVRALTDLGGPLFLTFASDPPSCLTVDDKSKVSMSTLQPPSQDSDDEDSRGKPAGGPVSFDTAEPTAVHQVLVATMIPDSDRLTLKAYNGKYLSSDKFGIVTAHTEAIGMQEEWTAIIKADEEEGGIAFQNHYGKFLSVDEVATETGKGSGGGIQIRADSETIGFCEIFRAKIQARFRKKAKKASGEVKIVTKDYEFDQSRKFQTWNHGRVIVSNESVKELNKAKKEGRFSEALLDRREKLKSDRYCK